METQLYQRGKAEQESGSCAKAIRLFRDYLRVSGPWHEHYVDATHMLGVCLRVMRQYQDAQLTLDNLLALKDIDPATRGRILCDLADANRMLGNHTAADLQLQEALDIFEARDGTTANQAIAIGFRSRVAASQGEWQYAARLGEAAAERFREYLSSSTGPDRRPELYHAIHLARVYVHAGLPDKAWRIAHAYLPLARQLGKPIHVQRLDVIGDLAEHPSAMEEVLAAMPPE